MMARLLLCASLTLALVGFQDGSVRRIDLTLTEGTSMAAAASPDGRFIAIDLVGAIWVLPMSGGPATKITPDLLEARQPTWSPDSQTIAFQGYDDGAWHVYTIPRTGGEPRALTNGVFDDREPAWSHDGSRIAFSSDRFGGITTIWTVNLGNRELRQVSRRDGTMPSWAPNDQEITFASRDEGQPPRSATPGLWMVDASGRERLLVSTKDSHGMPAGAGWSPDGTGLAFTTVDGNLSASGNGATAGRIVWLAQSGDVFPFRPQWISGTEFIFTANGHIVRASSLGHQQQTIPFSASVSLQRRTYSIAHRALEPADPQRVAGIVNPVVSPDGKAVAFTALGDLWLMPIGDAPIQLTNDRAVDIDPAWSPNGRQLAFISDRGGHMDLWVRDIATGADSQITHEKGALSGPAWSPDGSHIAVLVDRVELLSVPVVPGGSRAGFASPNGHELGRPTWSGDGLSVAMGDLLPYSDRYREGLNQLLLYNFELQLHTSTVLFPEHSAGNRQDNGPVWSPNGLQMTFVTEGKLWTADVDNKGAATAPPFTIADDQPESPSWEGDSRHIVYQTPNGLRRVLADGGPPESIPLDLSWRTSPTPARVVVHAGHVFDATIEGLRGESDIVIERGLVKEIVGHRDELHVGAVVDASSEYVMPA